MGVTETDAVQEQRVRDLDRDYVLHSWSVQSQIKPLPVAAERDATSGITRASATSISPPARQPQHRAPASQALVEAIVEQARTLCTIAPTVANDKRSELARAAGRDHAGNLKASFFTNGGAEANENAIKLARWYTGRHKIIARYRSYHGATAGAITLTGDPRRWFAGRASPASFTCSIPTPTVVRLDRGRDRGRAHCRLPGLLGRTAPRRDPQYEGPHTVAAVLLETVTGTNGIIVPPDGYLQSIREVCDRHGILLILDEVMAGFGRTGRWFAADNWNVTPDIMTVAKGINSGYVPLGAVVVSEPIAEWLQDKYLAGGLTYSGHPLACAAAVASIGIFREERIVENAAAMGDVLATELPALAARHPSIGEVRGLGLFWVSSWCATAPRTSRSCRSTPAAKRPRRWGVWARRQWSAVSS